VERQKTSKKPKQSTVQLMFATHDPLEELHRAERGQENDYFRKLDAELLGALRDKSADEAEQAIRQYTRMRCPKCGEPLRAKPYRQGTIETCPGCEGIWLDKGKWEGFVGSRENGWLQRLLAGFAASTR
jgi:predicted RNA-binding Zn-ribbon protein involved in translation (DUF1610 family)